MPAMTFRSPTIKYKLTFCAVCNDSIPRESDEAKCDNCKKSFHSSCTEIQQSTNETIWLCNSCISSEVICTGKDAFEIKQKQTNSMSARVLRSHSQTSAEHN